MDQEESIDQSEITARTISDMSLALTIANDQDITGVDYAPNDTTTNDYTTNNDTEIEEDFQ
jgi:hypothetical protein